MAYRVRAMPGDGRTGFNRGGKRFLVAEWTVLSDEEITDAIKNEPLLIVERIGGDPAGETAAPIELPDRSDEELLAEVRSRPTLLAPIIQALRDAGHSVLMPGETFPVTPKAGELPDFGDEALIEELNQRGYSCWKPTEGEAAPGGGGSPTEKPLAERTVEELRALAADRGIEVPAGARKAEIVALLESGTE